MKDKESTNEACSRTSFKSICGNDADLKNADTFLEDFTDLYNSVPDTRDSLIMTCVRGTIVKNKRKGRGNLRHKEN